VFGGGKVRGTVKKEKKEVCFKGTRPKKCWANKGFVFEERKDRKRGKTNSF